MQQSIVNYTASLCAQFQSFNDTCVLYVQLYAPVVFSLLEQVRCPAAAAPPRYLEPAAHATRPRTFSARS